MRLLGYVFGILGILIVIVGNRDLSLQIINVLERILTSISQIVLQYATSQALTIGGLVVLVIGLILILLSYRR